MRDLNKHFALGKVKKVLRLDSNEKEMTRQPDNTHQFNAQISSK